MVTANKYNLARKAWPQNGRRIYCTINDVDMISCDGYHASIEAPAYKYINKMYTPTTNTPSNRAKTSFDLGDQVELGSTSEEFAELSNGTRLQSVFADYYKSQWPQAKWYNAGRLAPIALVQDGQMVAVIMPVRA